MLSVQHTGVQSMQVGLLPWAILYNSFLQTCHLSVIASYKYDPKASKSVDSNFGSPTIDAIMLRSTFRM